jgi:hypothetical protein
MRHTFEFGISCDDHSLKLLSSGDDKRIGVGDRVSGFEVGSRENARSGGIEHL